MSFGIIALSNLGKRAYISFWSESVARFILSSPPGKAITVRAISKGTYILPDDVIAALKAMDILKPKEMVKGRIIVKKSKVREWMRANGVGMESPVDPEAFLNAVDPEGTNGKEEEQEGDITE